MLRKTVCYILCSVLLFASAQQAFSHGRNKGKVNPHVSVIRQQISDTFSMAKSMKLSSVIRGKTLHKLSNKFRRVNSLGQVQLHFRFSGDPSGLISDIVNAGGRVEKVSSRRNIVQAWVPADKIDALAARPEVMKVKLPGYAINFTGSVTAESDSVSRANTTRGSYSCNGSGIKVGIISDGIAGIADSQATNDIPATYDAQTYSASGLDGGSEGTAMMEIVHDIAPGSALAFANPDTDLDMVSCIQYLDETAGCNVIADDLGFFDEPWFQDGDIGNEITTAVGHGKIYVSAAGNSGSQAYYEGNYSGITKTIGTTSMSVQNYSGGNAFMRMTVPAYSSGYAILQWNDPYDTSGNDYDLYLTNSNGTVVYDYSENSQSGQPGDNPYEWVMGDNSSSGVSNDFYIVVSKYSGANKRLKIVTYGGYLDQYYTATGSVWGHPAATAAIAAGAIAYSSPTQIEYFSSQGPTRIDYPSLVYRPKPDICGIDGVSVTGNGGFGSPFYGTSAAAPCVAAVAALLWSSNPSFTNTQVRNALQTTAVQLGSPKPNNIYGYGRVDAYNAVSANTWTITATAGANGIITPSGSISTSEGAARSFSFSPNAHYHISNVLVDGTSVGTPSSYTFTNIITSHSIEADFAVNMWTITATAGANGVIAPPGVTTTSEVATTIYTFPPNAHYHISNVLVDGTSVGTPSWYSFNSITENHSIEADFAVNTCTITATAGANGIISPSGTISTNEVSTTTYSISPHPHYHISNVLIDGTSVGTPSSYSFNMITGNHSIEADFAANMWTIAATAGANGVIAPPGVISTDEVSTTTYIISPNTHYFISNVLVDGTSVGTPSSYSFNTISGNHSIEADFTSNIWTITATAGANGIISPNGSVMTNEGSTTTYSFTPDNHYHISSVLVDGTSVGTPPTYSFAGIASDHTIEADFALNPFMITASAGANGTITPSGTSLLHSGESQTYMISAGSGYYISGILIDGVAATATTEYAFTDVTADHSIEADFASLSAPATTELPAVSVPEAATFSNITTTVIKANWSANSNPATTEYYCENVTKGTNSGWITDLNWLSVSLEALTSYEFRVKAMSGTLESGWTALGTATTEGYATADASVAGISIKDGDIISSNPAITVSISGATTTSLSMQPLAASGGIKHVYVDGAEAPYNVISSTDTTITIRLINALSAGTHSIKIITYDAAGTEYELDKTGLTVTSGAIATSGPALVYPNPYDPLKGNAKISYTLDSDTDIMIYIFDVNGDLTYKKRFSSSFNGGKAGYNEVTWNGKDLFGNPTANDVYLIRIVSVSNGKVIGKTKVLVMKGGVASLGKNTVVIVAKALKKKAGKPNADVASLVMMALLGLAATGGLLNFRNAAKAIKKAGKPNIRL